MTPFAITEWPCPAPDAGPRQEMALTFDRQRAHRLLILPAWFDEANKLRRQTVEVMRRLDLAGIDSVLPDLPGCNESEAPLAGQTLGGWRAGATAAARHFAATHVLAVRAGALIAPPGVPGWAWAPLGGPALLRGLVRARILASREAGGEERGEDIHRRGRDSGVELAGWSLGPALFAALEQAEPVAELVPVDQPAIGGAPLWRRAEPGESPEQADALAALLIMGMTGQ